MRISVVRTYLNYGSDEALVLPVNPKSSWNQTYNPTSLLACGGMFHFKAVELFRRYPYVKAATVSPTIDGFNDQRHFVFVRDNDTVPLASTIQQALSRARRSGFQKVILPLLGFNWFIKEDRLSFEAWSFEYLRAVVDCSYKASCQVPELIIVADDDPELRDKLQRSLKSL